MDHLGGLLHEYSETAPLPGMCKAKGIPDPLDQTASVQTSAEPPSTVPSWFVIVVRSFVKSSMSRSLTVRVLAAISPTCRRTIGAS
jgi:hypothetical protein